MQKNSASIEATHNLISILSFGMSEPRNGVAYNLRVRSIESLINAGADLNYINPVTDMPLLCYAARTGDNMICDLLIDHGARINANGDHYAVKIMMIAIKWAPHWLASMYARTQNLSFISEEAHNEFRLASGLDAEYEEMSQVILRMQSHRKLAEVNASSPPEGEEPCDVVLYDPQQLDDALARESGKTRDVLTNLKIKGRGRRMACASNQFSGEVLASLKERFPNFSEALDYIARCISLSMLSDKSWLSIPPLLLVGEPGIGKTKFLSAVSKALGAEFAAIGCGSVTAGWVLSGSSGSWSEGKPGTIFSTLRDGKTANPIIMLDEIDKMGGDPRYDSYGPLYQLLERETAGIFVDEAVTIPINCANIIWVASANRLDSIPEPIIQRFNTIHIDKPTVAQLRKIAVSVYSDLLSEFDYAWGKRFNSALSESVLDDLVLMQPREMRNKLLEAMGCAASKRTEEIFTLTRDDFVSVTSHHKPGIGFTNRG